MNHSCFHSLLCRKHSGVSVYMFAMRLFRFATLICCKNLVCMGSVLKQIVSRLADFRLSDLTHSPPQSAEYVHRLSPESCFEPTRPTQQILFSWKETHASNIATLANISTPLWNIGVLATMLRTQKYILIRGMNICCWHESRQYSFDQPVDRPFACDS